MMIFFGYVGFWFLLGLILAMFGRLKVTNGSGKFSLTVLLVWSLIFAVPSSLVHCAFLKDKNETPDITRNNG